MNKMRLFLYIFIGLSIISLALLSARPLNPWDINKRYPIYLVVDRSDFKLYIIEQGVVTKEFPVVIGRPRTKTPLGRWRVAKRIKFKQLGIYGFYKLQLDKLVKSKYIPTIYAIHGTNQEELLEKMPRRFSQGCVRLYNKDIAFVWRKVPIGTPVEIIP